MNLLGFNKGSRREDGRVHAAACGAQLVRRVAGVRALAIAAVRFRGKASGRRVVRRVPCGRYGARFLL